MDDSEIKKTIFVGNLSDKVSEDIIYELSLQAGPIISVKIPMDRTSGKAKNFGFVCFQHECSVPYAIHLLNGIHLAGRPINVQNRDRAPLLNASEVGVHRLNDAEERPDQQPLLRLSDSLQKRLGGYHPHSSNGDQYDNRRRERPDRSSSSHSSRDRRSPKRQRRSIEDHRGNHRDSGGSSQRYHESGSSSQRYSDSRNKHSSGGHYNQSSGYGSSSRAYQQTGYENGYQHTGYTNHTAQQQSGYGANIPPMPLGNFGIINLQQPPPNPNYNPNAQYTQNQNVAYPAQLYQGYNAAQNNYRNYYQGYGNY